MKNILAVIFLTITISTTCFGDTNFVRHIENNEDVEVTTHDEDYCESVFEVCRDDCRSEYSECTKWNPEPWDLLAGCSKHRRSCLRLCNAFINQCEANVETQHSGSDAS